MLKKHLEVTAYNHRWSKKKIENLRTTENEHVLDQNTASFSTTLRNHLASILWPPPPLISYVPIHGTHVRVTTDPILNFDAAISLGSRIQHKPNMFLYYLKGEDSQHGIHFCFSDTLRCFTGQLGRIDCRLKTWRPQFEWILQWCTLPQEWSAETCFQRKPLTVPSTGNTTWKARNGVLKWV